ncbi:MAG: hypothetical protein ACRDBT_10485 [Aeromonas sp.]
MNTKKQLSAVDFSRLICRSTDIAYDLAYFTSVKAYASSFDGHKDIICDDIDGLADEIAWHVNLVIKDAIKYRDDYSDIILESAEMIADYNQMYAETLASYQAMAEDAELTRIADERLKSPQGVVTVSIDDL